MHVRNRYRHRTGDVGEQLLAAYALTGFIGLMEWMVTYKVSPEKHVWMTLSVCVVFFVKKKLLLSENPI